MRKPNYTIYSFDISRPRWKLKHEVFAVPSSNQHSEYEYWTGNSQLQILQLNSEIQQSIIHIYRVPLRGQVEHQTFRLPRKAIVWGAQSGNSECITFNRQGTRIVWALKFFATPANDRMMRKALKGMTTSRAETKQEMAELVRLYAAPLFL